MIAAVSSIGSAPGRDFSTIDAWLTAVKALGTISISTYPNGVRGECYNDSEFFPNQLVFGGVDTSQFVGTGRFAITLTAAAGHSFADNSANALVYTAANGVALNFNSSASYPTYPGDAIFVDSAASPKVTSLLISRLQILNSGATGALYTDNNDTGGGLIELRQLIVDNSAGGQGIFSGTTTRAYNGVLIIRGAQDPTVCPHGGIFDGPSEVGAKFYGWTIVSPSDNTNKLHPDRTLTTLGPARPVRAAARRRSRTARFSASNRCLTIRPERGRPTAAVPPTPPRLRVTSTAPVTPRCSRG